LAYAADLWRMCIVNRIPAKLAAKTLRLDKEQTEGSVRLLRSCRRLPSPERLALVVMNDPGLDDADVAEMFGRSKRWATTVRSQADAIRYEEFIDARFEWLEENLQADHPKPDEILRRAMAIRMHWEDHRFRFGKVHAEATNYSWMGTHFAILPVSA
jgi:hypothetical protein